MLCSVVVLLVLYAICGRVYVTEKSCYMCWVRLTVVVWTIVQLQRCWNGGCEMELVVWSC